jgi:hypothetical protein
LHEFFSQLWEFTADSIRLAGELPNARLVVTTSAGHVPQRKSPQLSWTRFAIF